MINIEYYLYILASDAMPYKVTTQEAPTVPTLKSIFEDNSIPYHLVKDPRKKKRYTNRYRPFGGKGNVLGVRKQPLKSMDNYEVKEPSGNDPIEVV
jgi:hypothetical protein